LLLAEIAQKMIVKKTAVKILIVLSFSTILQSNINAIYFEKPKCQGGKKLLQSKTRFGPCFLVMTGRFSEIFIFF